MSSRSRSKSSSIKVSRSRSLSRSKSGSSGRFQGTKSNEDNIERLKGHIVRVNHNRGFGFLELEDDNKEVFFHRRHIADGGFDRLCGREDVEVTLSDETRGKNAEASKVWIIGSKGEGKKDDFVFGRVQRVSTSGGYAFMKTEDGREIFCHANALRNNSKLFLLASPT